MGVMKEHKDNETLIDILGVILVVAIVGSFICGILECFNIHTGVIGGIFCLVVLLFLVIFIVWQVINEIIK
jgi:hypothetical protein